jgi:uncharacterized protein (TIGR01777 family)
MTIAIVGGSGLVGRALTRSLVADGADVVVLSRDARRRASAVSAPARIDDWSPNEVARLAESIAGSDAVVNLAGARVAPWPWTRRRKALIKSSRVDAVRSIVDAIARLPAAQRPPSLVVVSGIDAYPESPPGDDPPPMTEADAMGTEFLAQVSRAIEEEACRAGPLGTRVTRLRMGHVLARDAELVWYLALPVRLFLGGRIGPGTQWVSWVHIDDAVVLFRRAMTESALGGVLNVTSPGACRQIDFVRSMARVLHRPTWFPAPAWLVRLFLGEQSALLLGSRRVAPARALMAGHTFKYPAIDGALSEVLGAPPGAQR